MCDGLYSCSSIIIFTWHITENHRIIGPIVYEQWRQCSASFWVLYLLLGGTGFGIAVIWFVLGVCTYARLHVCKDDVNCGTFHGVINPPFAC